MRYQSSSKTFRLIAVTAVSLLFSVASISTAAAAAETQARVQDSTYSETRSGPDSSKKGSDHENSGKGKGHAKGKGKGHEKGKGKGHEKDPGGGCSPFC